MPIIPTHEMEEGKLHLYNDQIYNGLDCLITHEVLGELNRTRNEPSLTYKFERALQAPVLEMMLRGFLIDDYERRKGMEMLSLRISHLQKNLDRLAYAVWDKPLNPRSPKQLLDFFYGKMKLPEVYKFDKGVKKLSTDREALEKLDAYFYARPIISHILAIRDAAKKLSVLETEIDPDGRMRTSYNIAGTETGRFSSSANAFGTGTNLQNITAELRKIFIADYGWKLCGIDLEQAESREVGWLSGTLFNSWEYLDACYAGDLHTFVCKMAWPELAWPDEPKGDRALADEPFYRNLSRRDLAKKLGHGSNYFGQPPTMARHAKIPVAIAQSFQENYFHKFPGIPQWHKWVAKQLQTTRRITTVFGRERDFFGRSWDDATLREAIAFSPQSATADRMNLIMYRVWKKLGSRVRLLAQVHDALYLLYREEDNEDDLISEILKLYDIDLTHNGRKLIVPGEAKVGWNWGNYDPVKNPEGLKKFKIGVKDERKRLSIMEQKL
jgi:DNA polymerase I